MHWKRLLFLALLVGGLAFAALRGGDPSDRSTAGGATYQQPLFAGLEAGRVQGLSVEYREYATTLEARKLRPGQWLVEQPYRARATAGIPEALVQAAAMAEAQRADGFDPSVVGLEEADLRITFVEQLEGDVLRRWTLDCGAADTDRLRMFARVIDEQGNAGPVVRVPLTFRSHLEVGPAHWRDRRLLGVPQVDILGLRRNGAIPREDGTIDPRYAGELDLSLQLDARGWWLSEPYRARISAPAVEALRLVLAQLNGRAILDPEGERRAEFGLDPPALEFQVELRDGSLPKLDFGRFQDGPGDTTWTVLREYDEPSARGGVIHSVLENDMRVLTQPLENLLEYDPLNAIPRTVEVLEVRFGSEGLRLERPAGIWYASDPDNVQPTAVKAEPKLASEAVQRLLEATTERFLIPSAASGPPVDPIAPLGSIRLELEGERELRGDLGPLVDDDGNVVAAGGQRLFRRADEDLWGVLDDDLAELAQVAPVDLERLTVIAASELEQRTISLSNAERRRLWTRDPDRGLWARQGSTTEDRSFALEVDGLLNLRVDRWRAESSLPPIEDPLEVTVGSASGASVLYVLGRCEVDGRRQTVVRVEGRQGGKVGVVPDRALERLEPLLVR